MRNARATAAVCAAAVCFFAAHAQLEKAQQNPASPQVESRTAAEIVLPPQLETGKPATLAVLDAEGRLLPGVEIALPEGRRIRTDSTGRARFVVTAPAGSFTAQVSDARISATADVVGDLAGSSLQISVSQYPRFATLDGKVVVHGTGFRGDADLNRVTFTGKPALVLASSPLSLVVIPGLDVLPGPAEMQIEISGKKSKALPLTMVSFKVQPPDGLMAEGKKSRLTISVRGTDQRLMLTVENQSPETIELTAGNTQRVRSSGGTLNRAVVGFRALRAGEFSISVKLAAEGP